MAKKMKPEYTLEELALLVDLPVRTIRFYIQKGMVDRPEGARKTARYNNTHLEQCLKIKQWSQSGLSLDRIAEALKQPPNDLPQRSKTPGEISVTTQIHLAPGVELSIDNAQNALSQDQIRRLAEALLPVIESIQKEDNLENKE
jgi:DNA-binding transcriptional MerR regulator